MEEAKNGMWYMQKSLKKGSLQRHMEQQHGIKDGQYLCRRVNTNKATFKVRIEK